MKWKLFHGIILAMLLSNMFLSVINLVKSESVVHDLKVSLKDNLKAPHHLSSGKSAVLNATVTNNGNDTEYDVNLQLLINGTVYLSSTAQKLLPSSTFWSAYLWTPEDGIWNLTVYAPPVIGESNVTNNVDTKLVKVCQDQPPIANFTYSPPPPPPGPIKGEPVTFNALDSYDPDWGTILNYTWDFGDSTPFGKGVIVNHIYNSPGNKTVKLALRDTEDLQSSISRDIKVYARPIASYRIVESSPYYVNQTLTFNATDSYDPDNSTAPNKGIVNYIWDFDDGLGNITQNPIITHTFTWEDHFTVALDVTDYDGLIGPYQWTIWVSLGRPVANFPPPIEPCYVCYPLSFDASASYDPNNRTGPTHGIAIYTWKFGDDNTTIITEPTITHHYLTAGIYNVILTVTDYVGLNNSIQKTVTVSLEIFVKVVDSESGSTTIVHNPAETFTVNITITNVKNLYSFYFNLSWPTPWMPPTWLDLFDPDAVTIAYGGFLGPIQDPNTGQLRIKWEYIPRPHEGYIIVNATLLVNEPSSGNGTLARITFKVATSGNCTLRLSKTILSKSFKSITPIDHTAKSGTFYTTKPVSNFTYTPKPATVNSTTTFYASRSYDPDGGNIINYEWNFDDDNVTTTSNSTITHRYNRTGTFNVNLTVTDDESDKWWIIYPVEVVAGRDVAIIHIEPCILAFNETTGLYETAGTLPIDVTVRNEGNAVETFNVTIYFNDTVVKKEFVRDLLPGENRTITFQCSIRDVAKGVYIIWAYADPVPGETEQQQQDNTRIDGLGRVYLQGDVNRDNATNILDAIRLSRVYGLSVGDPQWDQRCDLNCDGKVNVLDCIILAGNFGKIDP